LSRLFFCVFLTSLNLGTGQPAPQQAPSMAQSSGDSSSKDYSAEWATYYRSIGKVEEAEAIERSIRVRIY
jgi:far upstream element-binding protein